MKCRECGTDIAEKALVCFRCGAAVQEPETKPHAAGKTGRPLVVYAVFAILVLVALWLMLFR